MKLGHAALKLWARLPLALGRLLVHGAMVTFVYLYLFLGLCLLTEYLWNTWVYNLSSPFAVTLMLSIIISSLILAGIVYIAHKSIMALIDFSVFIEFYDIGKNANQKLYANRQICIEEFIKRQTKNKEANLMAKVTNNKAVMSL